MIKKVLLASTLFFSAIILAILFLGLTAKEISYTYETTIDKPVAKSWEVFMDPDRLDEWMANLQEMALIKGAPNEVGSVYQYTFLENGEITTMTETITAFVKEKRFAFDYDASVITGHMEITFEPKGDKTSLRSHTTARGETFTYKLLTRLFKSVFEKNNAKNFNRLKAIIENS